MPNHGNDGWQPTEAPRNIPFPPKVAPAHKVPETVSGMSLRDYIAIEAMKVFLACPTERPIRAEHVAIASYRMANEMLRERKGEQHENRMG